MVEIGGGYNAGTGVVSCPASYDYWVVTPRIAELQASINDKIASFRSVMNSHLASYSAELDRVVSDYNNADGIIDNIISRYEVPVNGFIADVSRRITDSRVSDAIIRSYGMSLGEYVSLPAASQTACNNRLSSQFTTVYNNAFSTISSIVSSNRTALYDKIAVVASQAFSSRLAGFVSVYKGVITPLGNERSANIVAATDWYIAHLTASNIDSTSAAIQPQLQSFIANFNAVVSSEGAALSAKIAGVKYSGAGANEKVSAAYADISSLVSSISTNMSNLYNSSITKFNAALASFANAQVNEAIAQVDAVISGLYNNAVSGINASLLSDRSKLTNLLSDATNSINSSSDVVKEFLVGSVPTSYIDSVGVRSFKRTTRNSALDLVNSIIASHTIKFNDSVKLLDSKQVSDFNTASQKIVADINSAGSSPNKQLPVDNFSRFVVDSRKAFEESVKDSNNSLNAVVYSKRDEIIKYIDKILDSYPVIRLTGDAEFPPTISTTGSTKLSFDVINVGGAEWSGWFGVTAVDEDGNKYFHNHSPAIPTKIPAGVTQTIVIDVPFNTYLAGKTPRSLNIHLVANTHAMGVS